jgi:hypothetical protein
VKVAASEDLAAPLGVSVPTISSWIDILELTGQVLVVPPFFENFGKRLVKSPPCAPECGRFPSLSFSPPLAGAREPKEDSSESAIGRAAWPDARHRHHVGSVVDLIEDAVFAYPDSKKSLMADHRLHSMRPRVLHKTAEVRIKTLLDRKRKPQKFPLSRGEKFEPIGHAL